MKTGLKTLIVIAIVYILMFVLGTSSDLRCQKPDGVSIVEWLPSVDMGWHIAHYWDCSEAAAYTSWLCRNCGYETKIVATMPEGGGGHLFIQVEVDGQWRAYDPLSYSWIEMWYCSDPVVVCDELSEVYGAVGGVDHSTAYYLAEYTWWVLKPWLLWGAL